MEEKIYDRQVTKQSLSNRVVDQQQIERHFTLHELTELYTFTPDLLDEPKSQKSRRSCSALPKVVGFRSLPWQWRTGNIEWLCCLVPQEKIITELLSSCKDQIVSFHEHESLLDHKVEEELSESERKAAWAEYKAEVIRLSSHVELHLNVYFSCCYAANINATLFLFSSVSHRPQPGLPEPERGQPGGENWRAAICKSCFSVMVRLIFVRFHIRTCDCRNCLTKSEWPWRMPSCLWIIWSLTLWSSTFFNW